MAYDNETLGWVYHRTDGKCHLCHKKLSFKNYGLGGAKGAWEVEHSIPRANGGTDHRNNLFPACITCNRSKATSATRAARSWSGYTKAPLSRERREEVKMKNALGGAVAGGLLWLVNPVAGLFGAAIGALIGHSANPEG